VLQKNANRLSEQNRMNCGRKRRRPAVEVDDGWGDRNDLIHSGRWRRNIDDSSLKKRAVRVIIYPETRKGEERFGLFIPGGKKEGTLPFPYKGKMLGTYCKGRSEKTATLVPLPERGEGNLNSQERTHLHSKSRWVWGKSKLPVATNEKKAIRTQEKGGCVWKKVATWGGKKKNQSSRTFCGEKKKNSRCQGNFL